MTPKPRRLFADVGIMLGIAAATIAATTLAARPRAIARQAPPSWHVADAPAELRPLVARADLIVVVMHDALIRELKEGLAQGGPAFAVQSTHIDVVGVIQRLGRGEGIAAGRTGDRIRTPTNAPRPWAAPIVKANAGRRARDTDGYVVDLGDKVGVLRPIAEGPLCRSCHGPTEALDPGVRAVLAERYPADRAINFADGEIRGWYWVELRKPAR